MGGPRVKRVRVRERRPLVADAGYRYVDLSFDLRDDVRRAVEEATHDVVEVIESVLAELTKASVYVAEDVEAAVGRGELKDAKGLSDSDLEPVNALVDDELDVNDLLYSTVDVTFAETIVDELARRGWRLTRVARKNARAEDGDG